MTYVPNAQSANVVDAKGDLLAASADNVIARLAVGANGQVLTADSAEATGVKWSTPTDDILKSFLDAKGDLISASADNTPVRLGVGTDGQFLVADSAEASGLKWVTSGGIQSSLVDAKGDIIAATADNTVARVAVGTDGQFLVADSNEASGLKWAGLASVGLPISTKTADYTATVADSTLLADSTSGNVTITLPAAASSSGHVFVVKKLVAANSVIIDADAAETIDGAATQTISAQYASLTLHCDGSAWFII